jgi:hypothetical protein
MKYKDYPFADVCKTADRLIADGWNAHQKFTCAGCGNRLTIAEPNTFHKTGTCDKCDAVTDIVAQGCNYMLIRGPMTRRKIS